MVESFLLGIDKAILANYSLTAFSRGGGMLDTLASGASGRKPVKVQIFFSVETKSIN